MSAEYKTFHKMVKLINTTTRISLFSWTKECDWKFRILRALPVFFVVTSTVGSFLLMWNSEGSDVVFAGIYAFGYSQIALTVISMLLNEVNVEKLFQWLHQLHQKRDIEEISLIFHLHLQRTQKFSWLFLRIMFYTFLMTWMSSIIYTKLYKKITPRIPFILQENWLFRWLANIFSSTYGTINLSINEGSMILIGIYFIESFNILSDLIGKLNESSKNKQEHLKFIVQFHVEVIEEFEKYCEAFFLVFLVQMATIVIILILTFSLIMTSSTNMMYYSVIATVMLQLTLFCFCGQIIHNKSERIFTDLYQTKWYEMELKEQKILLLMMKMSQRSLGIKVAGMYDINFVMFMQVLKVSFSYCTILYTLILNIEFVI
uniref:Odorant receptor n=1 Tax=Lutzomyia longipalpis TaxID=7200 RepID=A0A3F2ZDE9_LUTLO